MKYASWLFGIASIWAGILDLVFGEFEPAHQPIQAWSDHIPGLSILARIAALWLVLGGLALLIRPAARVGAAVLAILYAIFCLFPLPRVITAPHYLGHHPGVYIGVFVTLGQQVIVFIGALFLSLWLSARGATRSRLTLAARWLFGLSAIDFGLGHLTFVQQTAPSVPAYMPLGQAFWAVLTGIAFLLAGLCVITGVLAVLAARLTALMLLVFSVLVLTPQIFATPHSHVAWGSDAYNLTAVAATWIFSRWLLNQRSARLKQQSRPSAEPACA